MILWKPVRFSRVRKSEPSFRRCLSPIVSVCACRTDGLHGHSPEWHERGGSWSPLSDTALSSLYFLAEDMLLSIEFGRRIGQSGDTLHARDELNKHRFIEAATDYPDDSGFITRSIKGESIGRILTAEGKAPAELASILERIKRVVEAERKNT